MEKIKAGYLPLYIKLYDDENPATRKPLEAYMHTLINMLESQGLEIVPAEPCRIKEEFDAAAKKFNDADVDVVITQHLAYSPSLESIEALLSLRAPIVVLTRRRTTGSWTVQDIITGSPRTTAFTACRICAIS